MKTTTNIKVRGYHLDGYRHVNNARYLEFMEEARWDYLDRINALGYFHEQNLAFVIVNITIDYKWPGVQGDVLAIGTEMTETNNTSFVFTQTIFNETAGRDSAIARVTFVLLDQSTGKPVRVTDAARELLTGINLKSTH
ncbi:MAG: thioesterase family protein [Bacteroidota bacterium]